MASNLEQESRNYMDSLPEKMWIEILRRVPGHILISRCRLVSRSWNRLVTSIGRRNHFRLRLSTLSLREAPLLKKVTTVFKDTVNLPWSSCYLPVYSKPATGKLRWLHDGSFKTPQLHKFIGIYGLHIRKVNIGGDDGNFPFELLLQMPNLEVLEVTTNFNFAGWAGVTPGENGAKFKILPKLRRLSCRITDSASAKFLIILIEDFGVKLNWIELMHCSLVYDYQKVNDDDQKVIDDRVGTLIASIPFISTNFRGSCPYTSHVFSDLAVAAPAVQTFKLAFDGPTVPPGLTIPYGGPFGHFLSNNAQTLTKLEIRCEGSNGLKYAKLTDSLQIPNLRALKSLKLSDGRLHDSPFDFLRPFESAQFPALETVRVTGTLTAGDGGLPLFKLAHFPSVKELMVYDFSKNSPMTTEWDSIFPNLERFESGVNGKNLNLILSKMDQLEHLKLTLNTNSFERNAITNKYEDRCDGDVNSILCGFGNPDSFYRKSEDKIRIYRNTNPAPSLLSMKNLKTLSLDFRGPNSKLRDSGAYLSLLQMQPLKFLGVYGADISDDCKSKLRKYHVDFDCK